MKTLAAVLEKQNCPLSICELEVPSPKKGQVLVDIAYSGICQTQLNEMKGHKGHDPYLPHTLGHEGSGVVLEIGEDVSKVKKGDRVVLSWIKGTGMEVPGSQYRHGERIIQSGAISTFMQRAVISENRLIPITAQMPLKEAALLGCAIPTGAGVVFNEMRLRQGESIAIFGAGGVGLSAILAARSLGASEIIAVDIHEDKLRKAISAGATHALHAKDENLLERIRECSGGQGVDYALESAGAKMAMELAFSALKPNKGLCILAGNIPKGQKIELDPFDLIRGRQVRGTWGGGTVIDDDVKRYVDLFLTKSLSFDALVSHEIDLIEINDFMKDLEKGSVARGLIKF